MGQHFMLGTNSKSANKLDRCLRPRPSWLSSWS